MKLTRFVVATMATIITVTTLGTPTAVKAASSNNSCSQLNGNVITVSGSSQDEIKDKLKGLGINLNNLNLKNCSGFPNNVVPKTKVEKPKTEKPKYLRWQNLINQEKMTVVLNQKQNYLMHNRL